MKSEYSYYDYAMEDYKFLKEDYERNRISNAFCYISQNTCERFLKHIIDTAEGNEINKFSEKADAERSRILTKHSLRAIVNYITEDLKINIDPDIKNTILSVNGYYFSTRYPGEDSIFASKIDIDDCWKALQTTKDFTDQILELRKKKLENSTKLNNSESNQFNLEEEAIESEENGQEKEEER